MIGLVIWILLSVVSAFVISSEVGKMYKKDGQELPVTGWTGLWLFPGAILIIPAIVWFVKVRPVNGSDHVPVSYPQTACQRCQCRRKPCKGAQSRRPDSNRGPLHYE